MSNKDALATIIQSPLIQNLEAHWSQEGYSPREARIMALAGGLAGAIQQEQALLWEVHGGQAEALLGAIGELRRSAEGDPQRARMATLLQQWCGVLEAASG